MCCWFATSLDDVRWLTCYFANQGRASSARSTGCGPPKGTSDHSDANDHIIEADKRNVAVTPNLTTKLFVAPLLKT